MNQLKTGEHDLLSYVKPDTPIGALFYFALAVLLALLLSRAVRAAVHASMTRGGHMDRTTVSFLQQFATATIWVVILTIYAHLIPTLQKLGTALLAGASIVSVVIGLAAQSTLGNLVAGVSITLYRPFRLGDTLQVAAPTGTEIGVVETISLGYTTLRAPAGHLIILPNSVAASGVTINLNTNPTYAPWPLLIPIHLGHDVDPQAGRELALQVAAESADAKSIVGCFLTKVDATGATLELRLVANDSVHRDKLRSTLLAALSRRFAKAHLGGASNETPTFG
jgi:small-conductance mechanosensitive channel